MISTVGCGWKIISISAVVGHKVVFIDQAEDQNVGYSLGVIPDRIGISGEVANFVGVCHLCVKMDTYILPIGRISGIWDVFSVDECVARRLVVKKAPIFVDSGLRCSNQDVIAHMHYDCVTFFHIVVDSFSL